jgi:hypothetical protein
MTKLHELKIKYEQSKLAERVAWGVMQGHYTRFLTLASDEACSDYNTAYEVHHETFLTLYRDGRDYHNELDRYWRVVGRVSGWVSAACLVYLIVWSMT